MKKFKKYFWGFLTLATMVIAISGCSKFLDRKPLTATLDDLNQGALESQSLGLYNTLRSYAGFSTLPWIDFNSIRDDDAQKGSSLTDGAEINAEFETFQYVKDDWATNTYWNDHYYMINLCNKELHWADSLKVTDAASLRNVGEAHFFRAYAFFELLKAYGGYIPKIDYYYTDPAAGIQPNSSATGDPSAIYAVIDRDLDSASKLLPLNWSVGGTNRYPGRLTSGAANTLWAQTYLQRQQWAKVITLCNAVISSGQYSLTPNFPDIWKDGLNGAGKNGPESIFEEQSYVGAAGANWNGTQWGTSQNVRQGGADVSWNLGWGWNTPTNNLVNAWDDGDPRKAATILYSGKSDGGSTTGGYGAVVPPYDPAGGAGFVPQPYWNKKVYSDPVMRQFTGQINNSGGADWINHRILRYADVILMLAEAANENGDGATAEANLELIRARARGGNGALLPKIKFTSQAQMRTAIKNERRWEFAMEGYRFNDLVRWGDAGTVLAGLGYTAKCALYPIPQKALDLSGGKLLQNPAWK
jgi:hypothetical protein